MKILYLDTSSSFLYCGIVDDNELICEIKLELGKELSTLTLQNIKDMFDKEKLSPKSINKIIVVNGPGSFTGIRIGLTIAKVYAWSLNIPIIAISSLEAMAISSNLDCDFCVPIIDARRGYVYAGIYDNNYNFVMKNTYIKINTLKSTVERLGNIFIYTSNDEFDFSCKKYNPNILKIVNYFKNKESVNVHELDADYLKSTEAEETLSDK